MVAWARRLTCAALAALCAQAVHGQTLRWAARNDTRGMDPGAYVELTTINLNQLVYDALVERDPQQKLVPALATSWTTSADGLTWRFNLRRGVKFHDGTPLTAADVVFSIQRMQDGSSDFMTFARPIGTPVQIDALTVELRLSQPYPLLLDRLPELLIMSREWAAAHGAERVPDLKARSEAYTANRAMGTGRYLLRERLPGVRTVFARNPAWWGDFRGNVAEIVHLPIANDASRTAALLSGDVDFNQDVPPQDLDRINATPRLRLVSSPENRLIFFGFDQFRDELPYSNVRGRNPFKDARVREAFARAINAEALRTSIMRGQSAPAGCFAVALAGCMDKALDTRPTSDVTLARALMKQAGYGDGFELTLDCPSDRYVNDRALCVAVAGMLGRIGVTVKVDARTPSLYFPKIRGNDTSFYMLGWGGTADPQTVLDGLAHSVDKQRGKGDLNYGRLADPELDRAIDAAGLEMQPAAREALLAAAQRRIATQYFYLPLHRQMIHWASRVNVHPVIASDNVVRADWFRID